MKPEVIRIEDIPSQTVGGHDGFEAQRLLKLSSEDVTVRLINVIPGGKGPVPAHQHPDTHFFWVLEGTLELEMDDAVHKIPSGSCIEVPPGIVHQLRCGVESPLKVLAIKWK